MEILFDTASLADLEELLPVYPVSGVTTNPTILKAEGRVDFYEHCRALRRIIGPGRSLHIQVVASDAAGMVSDAHKLLDKIDAEVFVKVPTTEPGLLAMRQLLGEGVRVTATVIYSKVQGMLAIVAGANYIAPYFNRMESLDIDAAGTIRSLVQFAQGNGTGCQVLAASFKNVAQVSAAVEAGTQAVTVAPQLLRSALRTPDVTEAVEAFARDWHDVFGTASLL